MFSPSHVSVNVVQDLLTLNSSWAAHFHLWWHRNADTPEQKANNSHRVNSWFLWEFVLVFASYISYMFSILPHHTPVFLCVFHFITSPLYTSSLVFLSLLGCLFSLQLLCLPLFCVFICSWFALIWSDSDWTIYDNLCLFFLLSVLNICCLKNVTNAFNNLLDIWICNCIVCLMHSISYV